MRRAIASSAVLTSFAIAAATACGGGDDTGAAAADGGGDGATSSNDATTAGGDSGGGDAHADTGALDAGAGEAGDATTVPGLDPTFGGGAGFVTGALRVGDDYIDCMLRQSTGRLVVVAHNGTFPFDHWKGAADTVTFRVGTNGVLDTTWGPSPTVPWRLLHLGRLQNVLGCALQSDDRIVIAASVELETGASLRAIMRLTANGVFDPTFGAGKGFIPDTANYPLGPILVQADGKIIVSDVELAAGIPHELVRYAADGTRDGTFGDAGGAPGKSNGFVVGLAQQADGKLLELAIPFNGATYAGTALTRFDSAGNADMTFGDAGLAKPAPPDGVKLDSESDAIGLDNTGHIFVGVQQSTGYGVARFTSAGALDTTFGTTGVVAGAASTEVRLAVSPDGSYATLAIPNAAAFLVRHASDGALDPSFGDAGITPVPSDGRPPNIDYVLRSRAASGYAVADTTATNDAGAPFGIEVAGVTSAGAADTTFGTGGTTWFGGGPSNEWLTGVVARSDGKIVAAGYAGADYNPRFLARFDASGALDATFGAQGIQTLPIGVSLNALAQTSTGKLVGIENGTALVNQLTAAGALDGTFAVTRTYPAGLSGAKFYALAIDSQDRVIVAGYADPSATDAVALVRLTTAGLVDATFGNGGAVTTTGLGSLVGAQAVAVRADGKIVAAAPVNSGVVVLRYDSAGAPDPTFGGADAGTNTFTTPRNNVQVFSVLPASGGATVIVAVATAVQTAFVPTAPIAELVVMRITDAGAIDPTFGTGGTVVEPLDIALPQLHSFENPSPEYVSATLDASGRVVVATRALGAGSGGARTDMLCLRYSTAGALDASFGTGGRLRVGLSAGTDAPSSMALTPSGQIVVAGRTWSPAGGTDMALLRLK
jgi:uncharacterized delta-60 repeat protein